MPVYIMPRANGSDADSTNAILKKMGSEVVEISNLHDFVKYSDFNATQFISMDDLTFTKYMRSVADLTPPGEMPHVLFGAPGYSASPRFTSEAQAVIADDWRELESTFLKSGLTATNSEEAQERSVGARKNLVGNTERDNARVSNKLSRPGS